MQREPGVPPILLLGDPGLRASCEPVGGALDAEFRAEAEGLQAALENFRAEHSFGRAMAAPQIGVAKRFIATRHPGLPELLVDPEIVWRSDATFTLWDDCMSFPDLLVRVRRHASITVACRDEDGRPCRLERLDRGTSELLQHEVDHLDGVLAVDRAEGEESLVLRPVFEADPERFAALVD
jgi:peptide deformylase